MNSKHPKVRGSGELKFNGINVGVPRNMWVDDICAVRFAARAVLW